MKYRKLGIKGPEVSTAGFVAWSISDRDRGNTDDVNGSGHSEELIRQVLDERSDIFLPDPG